jgi:hypothetical protein
LLLRNLDQLEDILTDVVDTGARQVNFVEFQTSKLKEIRANARRQAVKAAREKAELYCNAAGAKLGPVIYIEDVNPDNLFDVKRGQSISKGMSLGISHEVREDTAPAKLKLMTKGQFMLLTLRRFTIIQGNTIKNPRRPVFLTGDFSR